MSNPYTYLAAHYRRHGDQPTPLEALERAFTKALLAERRVSDPALAATYAAKWHSRAVSDHIRWTDNALLAFARWAVREEARR